MLTNIGCDQVSKTIVRRNIDYSENIKLLYNHITLTKIENSGAFLSLGESLPVLIKNILLSVLPLIAIAFGLVFVLTKTNITKIQLAGACFIIGGGIGNIFDRIAYGSVTDFLHIDFGIFKTGIFNMADVSIMTGTFVILIQSYFKRKVLSDFKSE